MAATATAPNPISLQPIPPTRAKRLESNDKPINVATFNNLVIRVKSAPSEWMADHGYLRQEEAAKLLCALMPMRVQVIRVSPDLAPGCWDDIKVKPGDLLLSCPANNLKSKATWASEDDAAALKEIGVSDPDAFKADLWRLLFPTPEEDQALVPCPKKRTRPDDPDDISALLPLPPFEKELKRVPLSRIRAAIEQAIEESNEVPIELNLYSVQRMSVPDKSYSPPDLDLIERVVQQTCSLHYNVGRMYTRTLVLEPKKKE